MLILDRFPERPTRTRPTPTELPRPRFDAVTRTGPAL